MSERKFQLQMDAIRVEHQRSGDSIWPQPKWSFKYHPDVGARLIAQDLQRLGLSTTGGKECRIATVWS